MKDIFWGGWPFSLSQSWERVGVRVEKTSVLRYPPHPSLLPLGRRNVKSFIAK
jgi:hypothetical protein